MQRQNAPVDGVEVVDDGGAAGVAVRPEVPAHLEKLVLDVVPRDLPELPLDLPRLGLADVALGLQRVRGVVALEEVVDASRVAEPYIIQIDTAMVPGQALC